MREMLLWIAEVVIPFTMLVTIILCIIFGTAWLF